MIYSIFKIFRRFINLLFLIINSTINGNIWEYQWFFFILLSVIGYLFYIIKIKNKKINIKLNNNRILIKNNEKKHVLSIILPFLITFTAILYQKLNTNYSLYGNDFPMYVFMTKKLFVEKKLFYFITRATPTKIISSLIISIIIYTSIYLGANYSTIALIFHLFFYLLIFYIVYILNNNIFSYYNKYYINLIASLLYISSFIYTRLTYELYCNVFGILFSYIFLYFLVKYNLNKNRYKFFMEIIFLFLACFSHLLSFIVLVFIPLTLLFFSSIIYPKLNRLIDIKHIFKLECFSIIILFLNLFLTNSVSTFMMNNLIFSEASYTQYMNQVYGRESNIFKLLLLFSSICIILKILFSKEISLSEILVLNLFFSIGLISLLPLYPRLWRIWVITPCGIIIAYGLHTIKEKKIKVNIKISKLKKVIHICFSINKSIIVLFVFLLLLLQIYMNYPILKDPKLDGSRIENTFKKIEEIFTWNSDVAYYIDFHYLKTEREIGFFTRYAMSFIGDNLLLGSYIKTLALEKKYSEWYSKFSHSIYVDNLINAILYCKEKNYKKLVFIEDYINRVDLEILKGLQVEKIDNTNIYYINIERLDINQLKKSFIKIINNNFTDILVNRSETVHIYTPYGIIVKN